VVLVGLLLYSDEMAEVRYIDRVKQKITLALNSSRYKSLQDVTSAMDCSRMGPIANQRKGQDCPLILLGGLRQRKRVGKRCQ
jgi:hypothetical protein